MPDFTKEATPAQHFYPASQPQMHQGGTAGFAGSTATPQWEHTMPQLVNQQQGAPARFAGHAASGVSTGNALAQAGGGTSENVFGHTLGAGAEVLRGADFAAAGLGMFQHGVQGGGHLMDAYHQHQARSAAGMVGDAAARREATHGMVKSSAKAAYHGAAIGGGAALKVISEVGLDPISNGLAVANDVKHIGMEGYQTYKSIQDRRHHQAMGNTVEAHDAGQYAIAHGAKAAASGVKAVGATAKGVAPFTGPAAPFVWGGGQVVRGVGHAMDFGADLRIKQLDRRAENRAGGALPAPVHANPQGALGQIPGRMVYGDPRFVDAQGRFRMA